MADDPELLRWRSEFPTIETSTHLISHSLGAMPRGAREQALAFLDRWEEDSIEAWQSWLPAIGELADTVAKVVGAPPGSVSLNQNVSTINAVVASCLGFSGPRKRVVYTDQAFPGVHYVWRAQARRGAEVHVVDSDGGVAPPLDRLLEAIDERTAIVPVSHVLFRSGAMQDLGAIVERAHAVGALVFADCYQSAGTVPLRLEELGVDLACGGSVKWACGGPGMAWLYVRAGLERDLEPSATGWLAHERPFAFDMGPMRWAPGAARLLGGTPPVPAFQTARAGWEMVADIGVERIRVRSLEMTARLREAVEERGHAVRTPRPEDGRGGTLCFDVPEGERVVRELVARRFFCDWRPDCGVRVGPHFYNTDDELDAFVAELDAILGRA